MKKVTKVKGVLNKEKGLMFEQKTFNVLSENKKALVIDTDYYDTIYKGKRDSDYKEYLNEAREVTSFVTGDLIVAVGYYENSKKGESDVKKVISSYLEGKSREIEKYKKLIK